MNLKLYEETRRAFYMHKKSNTKIENGGISNEQVEDK